MFAQDEPSVAPAATPEATSESTAQAASQPVTDPALPQVANFGSFEVQIYNQVGLVFKGDVKALSSANSKGEFSILPGHTNFISLITQPVMLYPKEGQPKKMEVGLGVLRCLHNQVEIFTGLLVDKETQAMAETLQARSPGRRLLGLGRPKKEELLIPDKKATPPAS